MASSGGMGRDGDGSYMDAGDLSKEESGVPSVGALRRTGRRNGTVRVAAYLVLITLPTMWTKAKVPPGV
jgi:hypothetical protein